MRANGHSTGGDITSVKVPGDTKITKFDFTIAVQEQVSRLEISMDHAMIVCVLKGRTDLSSDFNDNGPSKPTFDLKQSFDRPTIN